MLAEALFSLIGRQEERLNIYRRSLNPNTMIYRNQIRNQIDADLLECGKLVCFFIHFIFLIFVFISLQKKCSTLWAKRCCLFELIFYSYTFHHFLCYLSQIKNILWYKYQSWNSFCAFIYTRFLPEQLFDFFVGFVHLYTCKRTLFSWKYIASCHRFDGVSVAFLLYSQCYVMTTNV